MVPEVIFWPSRIYPMSLTVLTAFLAINTAQVIEPRLMHYPAIHGDTLVFTYAGDLWVSTTQPGSIARRLTSQVGGATRPKISPDGTQIAFTASYEGLGGIYVMPIEGGEPKRLTFEPVGASAMGWTPDGKIAYTSSYGSSTNRDDRLWLISPNGGLPERTPIQEIGEGSFMADGHTIAYQRVKSQNFNWRRYRGGTQGRISLYDMATNTYLELPSKREQSYYPMAVGRSIFYISDRNTGTLNLYSYNLDNSQTKQLSSFTDEDIKRPSTDGKSIVFERDGYVFQYDIASAKSTRLSPRILSDNPKSRPMVRSLVSNITGLSLSPNGVRVAIEARGRIFTVPTEPGDTRLLTTQSGARERTIDWSPDGKSVAFLSDATGEYELYTRPATGGPAIQITTGAPKNLSNVLWSPNSKLIALGDRKGDISVVDVAAKTIKTFKTDREQASSTAWSPDSKWIAYIKLQPSNYGATFVYNVATGLSTRITEGFYNDLDVTFDQNGKFLYILSDRTFNQGSDTEGGINLFVSNATRAYVIPLHKDTPNPLIQASQEEATDESAGMEKPAGKPPEFSIDFDGIEGRALPLPWPADNYAGLVSTSNGVIVIGASGISKFDLGSRTSLPIYVGPPVAFAFNQKGTKMAYAVPGRVGVVDVRPGIQIGQGAVDLAGLSTVVIDFKAEWKQTFWEAWRWTRDNYYDPKMRGLDWRAIGEHYAAYLPFVNNRADLNEIIGLMIGETGTGHSYVGGGDPGIALRPVPVGLLGVDYEAVGEAVKLKKVYRGFNFDETRRSPLGAPGLDVKDGEYLLAIDGEAVSANVSPSSLLVGKVGRFVTLTLNSKPNMTGARKVRVKPIDEEVTLRYADWVESRRQMVSQLSGGKIGYIHIPDTSGPGASGFARGFGGQADKGALVVDERNNGGGNLPWFFIDRLARKSELKIYRRNGTDQDQTPVMSGPMVMLINQNAGSGGDMFPFLFRRAKLGPLVGKRTWGGLVGISGSAPLVDGGFLFAPEFALYDPATNEIAAENQGVDPDVDIDNRPDLVAASRDPQLEKAVEILLEKLKKAPAKKVRTEIPHVGKNGQIGG